MHNFTTAARTGEVGETKTAYREDGQGCHSLPDRPAKVEGHGSLEEVCRRNES